MTTRIRLVTFDVLHTIITPRQPIHVQYAEVFRPYLGAIPPERIKASFKIALEQAQREFPAYEKGHIGWWTKVVNDTALGAGADAKLVSDKMTTIIPILLKRFSSREGYLAFPDAIPTIEKLHAAGVRTGIVSNGDSRFRKVLEDLGFPEYLGPIILSEEVKIEKPDPRVFEWALRGEGLRAEECLHVGDELEADFVGAKSAKWNAALLKRSEGGKGHTIQELGEVLNLIY
ncbi:HAD-superfamily hydrolase [Coprinopsis marcescibilis]|uniref:HAD-superfamily hydrolase n=1 Tax=Coprinopsis marcescibilis TaxID=230819 RepID=A0A5C3KKA6_COPMA|nr:HAD-superfamily hydrolase [Coprinopsis marcescibilis]